MAKALVYFTSPPDFLRIAPARVLWALMTRGVRTGQSGQLMSADGLSLSDAEIIELMHLTGIESQLASAKAARVYELSVVTFVRELARVKHDIVILTWTRGTLDGSVDNPSPWRFKRAFSGMNLARRLQKIDWALADLGMMAASLGAPSFRNADETLKASRAIRKQWRKFLTDK